LSGEPGLTFDTARSSGSSVANTSDQPRRSPERRPRGRPRPRHHGVGAQRIAAVPGATHVDALVMASAAQGGRGDTSDFDDLDRLGVHFSSVGVLSVSGVSGTR
jgi:hypothetical protein